jgi:hypothetical protein
MNTIATTECEEDFVIDTRNDMGLSEHLPFLIEVRQCQKRVRAKTLPSGNGLNNRVLIKVCFLPLVWRILLIRHA